MTRRSDVVIDTPIVRIDDTVTDPDRFLNVADYQRIAKNYNAILSQCVRRTIVSHNFRQTGALSTFYAYTAYVNEDTYGLGTVFFAAPFTVSPRCFKIRVNIKGAVTSTSGDVPTIKVYPEIINPSNGETYAPDTSVEFTSTTQSVKGFDLGLLWYPNFAARFWVRLKLTGHRGTTKPVSSAPVTDVGDTWVETSSSAFSVGDWLTFSDTEIAEQVVVRIESGTNYKLFVPDTWNKLPIPGTTTIDGHNSVGLTVTNVSIYELEDDVYAEAGSP